MNLLRLWWNGPAMPTLQAITSEEMVFRCSKCHLLIEGTRNFAMHENLCESGRHK